MIVFLKQDCLMLKSKRQLICDGATGDERLCAHIPQLPIYTPTQAVHAWPFAKTFLLQCVGGCGGGGVGKKCFRVWGAWK